MVGRKPLYTGNEERERVKWSGDVDQEEVPRPSGKRVDSAVSFDEVVLSETRLFASVGMAISTDVDVVSSLN
jgi:hypothetical protein